jgi:outer membrane receptor protein involved in Fe transport
MKRFIPLATLAMAVSFASPTVFSDDHSEESKYIEEVIVTGERGQTSTLDRAMTVTGFNSNMIEQLGIQNMDDLETLVPGLQKGVVSSAGKQEDGHLVMRGVANDRRINFFQDASVAVYVDGIYNPMSYGLGAGMFDVERVEVARGPQGTTGGKTAIAGSLSFVTKKPTEEWDMKATAELTDQASQQLNVAFGGPLGDSGLSYRLAVSRLTGDGLIENVGAGPDAGKPDRLQYSPQLRFTNDRWDVTARYNKLTDTGVQKISLIIGARNSEEQYYLLNDGRPRCETDPAVLASDVQYPDNCITDANGNIIYYINPNYGLGQNVAVANCPGFNNDGTRDAGLPVVCDGDKLQLKTELNAPLAEDNSQETYSFEAHYTLNDTHELVYLFGDRDTRTDISNDGDGTSREPGGVCSAIHPRVKSGELQEGQTHPRCALDGAGNGAYADSISNYLRTSAQISHEFKLISNNDGPLNYTLGYTSIVGDEPYVYRDTFNGVETGNNGLNNPDFYKDTTAICEAELAGLKGGEDSLWRNILDSNHPANKNAGYVHGCRGSDYSAYWSDVTNGGIHVNGGNVQRAFYGNVSYEQTALYANVEYVLNDEWKVFGGFRANDDHKEHEQNDFSGGGQYTNADGVVINTVFGIFRSQKFDYVCCGYVGLENDANGNPIPDDRTLADSKVKNWKENTWNIGAEYTPSDNMMWYGRISRGYRAGGFAGFGNQLGEGFDAETMINYEGGLKGLFLDSSVQLEIGVYFQDFDSFWTQASRLKTPAEQALSTTGSSAFTGETVSVDGTDIAGIEAQGAWQINDRLVLRGFYEYMYSSFGDYETRYCCTPGGDVAAASTLTTAGGIVLNNTGTVNFGGHSLRMQPSHKYNATLTYDVPMSADLGSLDVVTILAWRDTMFPDEGNLEIYEIPSYTRWDIRTNWTSPSGTYSVSGWVTNVLDLVQVQSYSPRDGNGVTAPISGSVTDSRRIGLTFNYQL